VLDRRWAAALAFAGCGGAETEFVVEYVNLYCEQYLACADPALQVFDGMGSAEQCEGTFGPPIADQAAGCKLEKRAARECLDGMAALQCPGEGEVFDDVLPPACATVWQRCDPQAGGEE
jgi:hypothetical protein